jgi:hypothetical protein
MFVSLLLVHSAGAFEVELPGEGNVFNSIPFDKFWGETRYQQIYDNSIFPPEEGYIEQISFIPDSPGEYGADIEIILSHTTALPGELSTIMDENITGPEEVVFSDPAFYQVLTIDPQDPDNPVVQNSDYGLTFVLDTPFPYHPDQGNLLMEINISNQFRPLSTLKIIRTTPCLTSRAYESQYGPGVDATPAGLDTLFTLSDPLADPPPVADLPQVDPPPTDNTPVYHPPVHSGTTLIVGCSTTGGNSDAGIFYLFVLLPLAIRWCGKKWSGMGASWRG